MKKSISLLLVGLFLMVVGCQKDSLVDIPFPEDEVATSFRSPDNGFSEEVETAIENGVAWLVTTQQNDGSFSTPSSDKVARTALAVTKLCDRSIEMGYTPQSGPYATAIADGLNFILLHAQAKAGGLVFNSNGNYYHETYNSGIALMAIAAFRDPDGLVNVGNPVVDGKTYLEVAQEGVDFFVASQNPDGGWRYFDTQEPSDQSNTGFVTLGLLAAEQFGCTIPDALKSNLSGYIDYTQNDASGGGGYTGPNDWVNTLKTGNLLFEMAFVGDTPDAGRVQAAINYIQSYWNAPGGGTNSPGWQPNNYLAMYCMMKGFQAIGVETIIVSGTEVSWYDAFTEKILAQQLGNGSWPNGPWTDTYLSTIFNLLTLEKITPVPYVEVFVDIKPTSCPNPFNMKAKGILPVAILGTEDFDVSQIDVSTVLLEGVPALQSNLEDVASPVTDPNGECECTTDGSDGYVDLTLKFERQAIATAIGEVSDGDVVVLAIEGNLVEGQAILGSDCVIIKKKGPGM